MTPTASPGSGSRLLEAAQDDRGGLDEHAGVEGDVLGQAVHDLLGHRDQLRVATRPREPERLDALAPVRLAAAAGPAAMADDHSLADDAVARRHRFDVRPDLDDGARPLVARDDREAHPPRVGEDAGHHLDVGPAQARLAALDEDVVGPHGRRLHLSVGDRVGSLDDDRLHAETILRAVSAIADLASRFSSLYTGALTDVLDRHGLLQQTLPPELVPLREGMRLAGPVYPVLGRPHPGHDYDTSIRRVLEMLGSVPSGHVAVYQTNDAHLGAPGRALGHLAGDARLRRRRARRRGARRRVHPARGLPGLRALRDPAGLRATVGAAGARRRRHRRRRGAHRTRRLDRRDRDGLVVVPGETVDEILGEAEEKVATESEIRESVRGGALRSKPTRLRHLLSARSVLTTAEHRRTFCKRLQSRGGKPCRRET